MSHTTSTYQTPAVRRFGTFRELTQQGFQGPGDGFSFGGATGNNCQDYDVVGNFTTLTCIIGSGSR